MHAGVRDYLCDFCGKGFLRHSHWKVHMKRHRNEKNFSCKECHQSFITNADLLRYDYESLVCLEMTFNHGPILNLPPGYDKVPKHVSKFGRQGYREKIEIRRELKRKLLEIRIKYQ